MQAAKRIVVNAGFLYGKMVIRFVIALWSTRLILQALGITDFGIFNLVGGVIAMLYFLNAAMSASTQRFMSYFLGANDLKKIKDVFRTSVILHLIIGIIVVIALEIIGLFVFNGFLNIPPERIPAAKVVYHFMVVSTFFTINAVPYNAAIFSRENMLYESIVGVAESIAKLGIALYLIDSTSDRLILYSFLIALLTILTRIANSVYCLYYYEECRINLWGKIDFNLAGKMFSFAGWNLFGALCNVSRAQGLPIILNLFFGTIVNAAHGIATQVNGQLISFSSTLARALNPQIIKSEGGGNRERMLRLTVTTCKFSLFLLSFFALPFLVEMPYVLNLWLKEVPPYSVIFCRLLIIRSLISQLSRGLLIALQAVGKIKAYQAVVGTLIILNLPLAYLLIIWGFPAYSVFVGAIVIEIIAGGCRIWFAHKLADLKIAPFLREVWGYSTVPVILSLLLASTPLLFMEESFFRAILVGFISCITLPLLAKYIALSQNENDKIKELALSFLAQIKKKLNNSSIFRKSALVKYEKK